MIREVRVVAEIGQAKGRPAYVADALERVMGTGVWGVKVQLLQPDRIAAPDAAPYWPEARPDIPDQRANFARTGCLPYDAHVLSDLWQLGQQLGLELFATPFDERAVDVMRAAGMRWCKLASGDLTNERLVRCAAAAFGGGGLILSTGAATAHEIADAMEWVRSQSGAMPAYVLACSLAYPTPDPAAEIARVTTLSRLLEGSRPGGGDTRVGYSDHTHGTTAAAVAVGAGATMLEKHVTLDMTDPDVPDNAFALLPPELGFYVDEARHAATMMGSGRLSPTAEEGPARQGAYRSLYAVRPLAAGHVITRDDFEALRPVVPHGFEADESDRVIGRRLEEPVTAGRAIPRAAVKGA